MTSAQATRPVLLIGMGGPRNPSEVKVYLRRLFSDPHIIPGGALKRWLLSRLIARAATPRTRARYALIGGKSNAVEDTQRLARQVTEHFATRGITVECVVATRYSAPSIEDGLAALTEHGDQPVTPVYLFPHETSAMTGSCADVLERAAARLGVAVETGVRHLGATEGYAQGWADAIKAAVDELVESSVSGCGTGFPAGQVCSGRRSRRPTGLRDAGRYEDESPTTTSDDVFVLFSCHSLPRWILERGDPYADEIKRSVELIQSRLGDLACGLAYQSREADDWLGPKVEEKAAEACEQGFRKLIVAPLSFVGENPETLVDLDRDLREAALSLGFQRVKRLSTPDRLGFLGSMVVEGLCKEWGLEY